MANRKLTALPELTSLEDNDWEYSVDISDTLESPQGTSKKVRKSTTWDYIRVKADARYGTVFGFTTLRFTGVAQTYTLPDGYVATKGWINDGVQHKEQAGFESDLNTFTQVGTLLTFKMAITAGKRIYIDCIF